MARNQPSKTFSFLAPTTWVVWEYADRRILRSFCSGGRRDFEMVAELTTRTAYLLTNDGSIWPLDCSRRSESYVTRRTMWPIGTFTPGCYAHALVGFW